VNEPTFGSRKELVRYIDEINRHKGNRPAPAAFIDLAPRDAKNHHLSVNSTELEHVRDIADYFRALMKPSDGKVALCIHKVHAYSEAGRKAGVQLTFNKSAGRWEFKGLKNSMEAAYKYRPSLGSDVPVKSKSHCGVEFARVMDYNAASKFARRLTRGRFHVFSE
jgi:hypothetical protein